MSTDGQSQSGRQHKDDAAGTPDHVITSATRRPLVLFVCEWVPRYQTSFFASLRSSLEQRGIELRVAHGDPPDQTASRRDSARLPWAAVGPNRYFRLGARHLVWQPWTREALASDLVIVDQASRLLLNYWLLLQQARGRVKVALLGHGANLNVSRASSLGERIKVGMSRRPHWWFAYTEGARQRVESFGYPSDRITVIQNSALDENTMHVLDSVSREDVVRLRGELGLGDGPVGLFLGSLYDEKRWRYLLAAAERVRSQRSDFALVIAGDGPDRSEILHLTSDREYIRVVGRADGLIKATLLRMASLLLVPGGLGLAITDAFGAGLPTITTAVPTHGPEIEYLDDGVNGHLLPRSASPAQYAEAVLAILGSPTQLRALSNGARKSAAVYTEAVTVARFRDGIERAMSRGAPLDQGRETVGGTAS